MLIELSYELRTIEKQLELISSRIQYTVIEWIWESLACPNRYSFMFFIARCQVATGLATLYGRAPSTTISIDDTDLRDSRNTVFKFQEFFH